MASNVTYIKDLLLADVILVGTLAMGEYPGILRGGVWERRLKREPPGNTPHAFSGEDEAAKLIRPAAVVLDRGDEPHPQRPAIPSAYYQPVPIYLYAPATGTGKAALKDARRRIWELLHDLVFPTEDGPMAFVEYINRQGILDCEEFPEAVQDIVRYRITSRIANEV